MSETAEAQGSAVVVSEGSVSLNIHSLVNSSNLERALGETIDRLVEERTQWESAELARSNERLYAVLKACYALHNTMVGSDSIAKALRKGLAMYIDAKKYVFSDSAPLMTKIVKCIFGTDRRRVNAYATALIAAKNQKVAVLELPAWLKRQGGVEEVRRATTSKTRNIKERVKEGIAVLGSDILAKVQSDKLSSQFSTEKLEEGVVLLATREDDGSFAIRRVIQTGSVVKAAIASCADMSAAARKKKEAEGEAKTMESDREEAREALNKAA